MHKQRWTISTTLAAAMVAALLAIHHAPGQAAAGEDAEQASLDHQLPGNPVRFESPTPLPKGPLTKREIHQAMQILRDCQPDLAKRLADARKRAPEAVVKILEKRSDWIRGMIQTRKDDPEGYDLKVRDLKLERKTLLLGKHLREAGDPAEKEKIEKALRKLIVQHFDTRQAIRQRELSRLEDRLTDLRQQLKQRAAGRDKLIDERVKQVQSEKLTADW